MTGLRLVSAASAAAEIAAADLLVVGVRDGRLVGAETLVTALGPVAGSLAAALPVDAERVEVVLASTGLTRVVLVRVAGPERLGVVAPPDEAGCFTAAVAALAEGAPAGRVVVVLASSQQEVGPVVVGAQAGAWRYGRQQPDLVVVTPQEPDAAEATRAALVGEAANWVRELVETPPNLLGPAEFAARIAEFASVHGAGRVHCRTWDAEELARRGFGATLGVGGGSRRPPAVVELEVLGDGPVIALAGKGITFDSGGTNLKRSLSELAWMKSDMAAAASVAAAVVTAAASGSGPLHAVLPLADNAIGSGAQRPGDVVHHPDDSTTEIADTDCEGRLVLADALAWLAATAPALVIDVGTLTDSGNVGPSLWGCWSTAPEVAERLVAAGRAVGDEGWLLPLPARAAEPLRSRVADRRNTDPDGEDSARLAAAYLRPFAAAVPWIHIDNGSGAWLEEPCHPWPAGPTATPLRALVEFLLREGGSAEVAAD